MPLTVPLRADDPRRRGYEAATLPAGAGYRRQAARRSHEAVRVCAGGSLGRGGYSTIAYRVRW